MKSGPILSNLARMRRLDARPGRFSRLRAVLVGRRPARTLVRALVLAAGCYLLFPVVLLPVHVRGASMEPTVRGGRIGFANPWVYRMRDPRLGDIVLIEMAGRRAMCLKRVLAGPLELHTIGAVERERSAGRIEF